MKYQVLVAVVMVGSMFHALKALAALPDKDAVTQWGFANKATSVDEPLRLVVKEKDPADPNKLIDRDIAVTDIPKYVRPVQMLQETNRDYGLRIIAAQEAHSKLKAEKVAQAINTILGNGRATVVQGNVLSNAGFPAWNYFLPGAAQPTKIKNGEITITGAHQVTSGASAGLQKVRNDEIKAAILFNRRPENVNNKIPVPKPLTNNHTGEIGDGVKIKPGIVIPPPRSPGARGMMGTMSYDLALEFPGEITGIPMVATGVDVDGSSSVFEFGILDTYVASLHPSAGQTDEEVYLALESLLDANGLLSTYDPLARTLFLDGEFDETHTLYWAATDTGFGDFLTVSFGVTDVPEPSTLALWSLFGMVGGFVAWRKRRQ